MCCCAKPNVNGNFGYRWNGESESTRPVDPPELQDGETLVYDEPGRCGGMDSHCHHYRVVKRYSSLFLAYRHGGGDGRIRLSCTPTFVDMLAALDSNARYWMLGVIFHAHADAERAAQEAESRKWRTAIAEKRVRSRKYPAQGLVKVWIESATELARLAEIKEATRAI